MTSFRALPRLRGCMLVLTGCWLLLASCSTPTELEDKGRDLGDNQAVLPIIAAPAEGRRCDGVSGNTDMVTVKPNPLVSKQQPPIYSYATEDSIRSSIAVATDYLLVGAFSRIRSVERQYFEASARHDLCYLHGDYTYERDIQDCNRRIYADMYRLCGMADNNSFWGRKSCYYRPPVVGGAVGIFGTLFTKISGSSKVKTICEYEEGGFQPPRDHLVIGHFEGAPDTEQILEVSAAKQRVDDQCLANEMVLRGRLIDGRLARRDAFRLCPSKILLAYDKKKRNLGSLNFSVADLLSHAPVRARLESRKQKVDDIVLVAFRGPDASKAQPGKNYGTIMVPIRIDDRPDRPQQVRAFQTSFGENNTNRVLGSCKLDNVSKCWSVIENQDTLNREREMLQAPLYHVHVAPGESGEQLLSAHTFRGVNGGGIIKISTISFQYDPNRGFDLKGINSDYIDSQIEAYKRFQYPPIIFADDDYNNDDKLDGIHFLFRDPGESDLTTLMVQSYRPLKSPGSSLGLAWATVGHNRSGDYRYAADFRYGGVSGWSRETYIWMSLGQSLTSLGGENGAPEQLVGEFLSNCSDYAGKHCAGPETIHIRSVAKHDMMRKPSETPKNCGGGECKTRSCPDGSCAIPDDFKLVPLSHQEPRYSKDYMNLPVLTGRFGDSGDVGPGLVFFKARTDNFQVNVLEVWRPGSSKDWQAREFVCTLPNNAGHNAWDALRRFPLEVAANGNDVASTIMLSTRDRGPEGSLPPEIRYWSFGMERGGTISCRHDEKEVWKVKPVKLT